MHEWINKNREEARIDLTIQDFGRKMQAHGDYTIRSIDTTHLQKISSALSRIFSLRLRPAQAAGLRVPLTQDQIQDLSHENQNRL